MVHAWDLLENFKHRERLAQVGFAATTHTALDQARSVQFRSGLVWSGLAATIPHHLDYILCIMKVVEFNTHSAWFTKWVLTWRDTVQQFSVNMSSLSLKEEDIIFNFVKSKLDVRLCVSRRVEEREFFDKVNKGELTWENGEDLYTRVKSRRARIQVSCVSSSVTLGSRCKEKLLMGC